MLDSHFCHCLRTAGTIMCVGLMRFMTPLFTTVYLCAHVISERALMRHGNLLTHAKPCALYCTS